MILGPKLITTWGLELDVVAWPEHTESSLLVHFALYKNGKNFTNKDIFVPENRGLKNAFPSTNNKVSHWNEYYQHEGSTVIGNSYEILDPKKGAAIVSWTFKNKEKVETFSMVIRTSSLSDNFHQNILEMAKIKVKQKNVASLREKLVDNYGLKNPKIWDRLHIQIVPSNYEQIRNVSYETLKRMTGEPLPVDYQFLKGETIYITDEKVIKIFDVPYTY